MTSDQFRNAILLLNCIDADEFERSYWVNPDSAPEPWEWQTLQTEWTAFKENPARYYIHASAEHRNRLWGIIEKRLTKGESND